MTPIAPIAPSAPARAPGTHSGRKAAGLAALVGLLFVMCIVSITFGARDVNLGTIWMALTDFDPASASQTVIREMRIPRTIIGLFAGMALGLAGALLQASTRNPLADPGVLGINQGAAAAIMLGFVFFGVHSLVAQVWIGFAGAGIAVLIVYSVASIGREGATPIKLALSGVALAASLFALISALSMTNIEAYDEIRFWQVGSLAGRYHEVMWQTLPFLVIGSVIALFCGRALNGLALGDDQAAALGQNVRRTRIVLFATVALLCGAAVSACGPIVFLGLAVPQIARLMVGTDWRWVLAYSAALAPSIFLGADVIGRLVASPGELQVGVVLGILGAPVFIAIVRSKKLATL